KIAVQAKMQHTATGEGRFHFETIQAIGTKRSTCNYMVKYRLEYRALQDDGSIAAVTMGSQRHFSLVRSARSRCTLLTWRVICGPLPLCRSSCTRPDMPQNLARSLATQWVLYPVPGPT